MLPQHSLITMYKAFVRLHFDYRDILYEQPNNESLVKKFFLKKSFLKKLKVLNTMLLFPLHLSLEVYLR